jgi:hypothetical protein
MSYLADTSVQQTTSALGADQRVQTVTAAVTVPDATAPGRLLVSFPPNTLYPGQPAFASPEWVVNTTMSPDGSRYDSMVLSGGEGSYSAIFLLTRSLVLSAVEQARFDAFVKSTHFWLDVVSVQFPSQCYYGGLQSIVSPSTAAGTDHSSENYISAFVTLCSDLLAILFCFTYANSFIHLFFCSFWLQQ